MEIKVEIPPETITIAVSALKNAFGSGKMETKSKDDLSPLLKGIVQDAQELVEKGRFDEAISKLETALSLEPGYNRARLVMMDAFKEKGWSHVAIFIGGIAFGASTNPETKAMILAIAAKICSDAYVSNPDTDASLLPQAISLIEMGLQELPEDPILRWNYIDCIAKRGDKDLIGDQLLQLCNSIKSLHPSFHMELSDIIDEWDEVLGSKNEYGVFKARIIQDSSVLREKSLEDRFSTDSNNANNRSSNRKMLRILLLTGMIAGSPAVLSSSIADIDTSPIRKIEKNEGGKDEPVQSPRLDDVKTYNPYYIESSISHGKGKLLEIAAVSHRKGRLA